MAIISRVFASTAAFAAVAILSLADPANALVASGQELGHLAARHNVPGTSHHVPTKLRKRNAHQNRKRCIARPTGTENPPANSSPNTENQQNNNNGSNGDNTGSTGSNEGSNNNNNNNNNYTPPTYVPPSSGGGKVGIAWAAGNTIPMSQVAVGKASGYYTWSPWPVDSAGHLQHYPMMWGPHQEGDWNNLVANKPERVSDALLGFNEPDEGGQANMDPWYAAAYWAQVMAPQRHKGYRLGSPSTTSSPAPMRGLDWLRKFWDAVQDKPDFVTTHWYGDNVEDLKNHVRNACSFGVPVWVTEFACHNFGTGRVCDGGQQVNFVREAIAFLDNEGCVEKYMPFGFLTGDRLGGVGQDARLMDDKGNPNYLGSLYLGLTS